MLRFYLLSRVLVVVAACSVAAPTEADSDRAIFLSTQDANGTHFVTIVSSAHAASVRSGAPGKSHEPRVVPYSDARFNAMWRGFQGDSFVHFEVHGEAQETHIADNYAIIISAAGVNRMFLIPKCTASREEIELVKALAKGLLPEGSPGLFKPCNEKSALPTKSQ